MDIKGNNVLNGASGTVWLDNEKIMEVKEITAEVEFKRSDVQMGLSVDSKIVGVSGKFSLKLEKVYSRANEIFAKVKKGHDPRVTISAKVEDPDAVDGQIETVVLNNCWFNGVKLINIVRGNIIEDELSGGFTPTDAHYQDIIK